MADTETVRVDSGALREFREAVLARHGKLYGVLNEEATKALRKHARELARGE